MSRHVRGSGNVESNGTFRPDHSSGLFHHALHHQLSPSYNRGVVDPNGGSWNRSECFDSSFGRQFVYPQQESYQKLNPSPTSASLLSTRQPLHVYSSQHRARVPHRIEFLPSSAQPHYLQNSWAPVSREARDTIGASYGVYPVERARGTHFENVSIPLNHRLTPSQQFHTSQPQVLAPWNTREQLSTPLQEAQWQNMAPSPLNKRKASQESYVQAQKTPRYQRAGEGYLNGRTIDRDQSSFSSTFPRGQNTNANGSFANGGGRADVSNMNSKPPTASTNPRNLTQSIRAEVLPNLSNLDYRPVEMNRPKQVTREVPAENIHRAAPIHIPRPSHRSLNQRVQSFQPINSPGSSASNPYCVDEDEMGIDQEIVVENSRRFPPTPARGMALQPSETSHVKQVSDQVTKAYQKPPRSRHVERPRDNRPVCAQRENVSVCSSSDSVQEVLQAEQSLPRAKQTADKGRSMMQNAYNVPGRTPPLDGHHHKPLSAPAFRPRLKNSAQIAETTKSTAQEQDGCTKRPITSDAGRILTEPVHPGKQGSDDEDSLTLERAMGAAVRKNAQLTNMNANATIQLPTKPLLGTVDFIAKQNNEHGGTNSGKNFTNVVDPDMEGSTKGSGGDAKAGSVHNNPDHDLQGDDAFMDLISSLDKDNMGKALSSKNVNGEEPKPSPKSVPGTNTGQESHAQINEKPSFTGTNGVVTLKPPSNGHLSTSKEPPSNITASRQTQENQVQKHSHAQQIRSAQNYLPSKRSEDARLQARGRLDSVQRHQPDRVNVPRRPNLNYDSALRNSSPNVNPSVPASTIGCRTNLQPHNRQPKSFRQFAAEQQANADAEDVFDTQDAEDTKRTPKKNLYGRNRGGRKDPLDVSKITEDDMVAVLLFEDGMPWKELHAQWQETTGRSITMSGLQKRYGRVKKALDEEAKKASGHRNDDGDSSLFISQDYDNADKPPPTQLQPGNEARAQANRLGTRPTTGGKHLAPEENMALVSSVARWKMGEPIDEESSSVADGDAASQAARQASPVVEEDACHFVYFVKRKVVRADECEDDVEWIHVGRPHATILKANREAAEEFGMERGAADVWPLDEWHCTCKSEDGDMARWHGKSPRGQLIVHVDRKLRAFHEGRLPECKQGWLKKRLYDVLVRSTEIAWQDDYQTSMVSEENNANGHCDLALADEMVNHREGRAAGPGENDENDEGHLYQPNNENHENHENHEHRGNHENHEKDEIHENHENHETHEIHKNYNENHNDCDENQNYKSQSVDTEALDKILNAPIADMSSEWADILGVDPPDFTVDTSFTNDDDDSLFLQQGHAQIEPVAEPSSSIAELADAKEEDDGSEVASEEVANDLAQAMDAELAKPDDGDVQESQAQARPTTARKTVPSSYQPAVVASVPYSTRVGVESGGSTLYTTLELANQRASELYLATKRAAVPESRKRRIETAIEFQKEDQAMKERLSELEQEGALFHEKLDQEFEPPAGGGLRRTKTVEVYVVERQLEGPRNI